MSSNDRLTRSLPHLQNLIKRDPDGYREDVLSSLSNSTKNKFQKTISDVFHLV